MSDCRDTRDLLSPYLEGELSPEERVKVEGHLGECGDCRMDLDLLRRTVVALKGLPDLPPPAGILHGVREGLEPVPWHRRLFGGGRNPLRAGIPLGAVATVLVAFGIFLLTERFPDLGRPPSDLEVTPPPVRTGTAPPPPEVPLTAPAPERGMLPQERVDELPESDLKTNTAETRETPEAGAIVGGKEADEAPESLGASGARGPVVEGKAEVSEEKQVVRMVPVEPPTPPPTAIASEDKDTATPAGLDREVPAPPRIPSRTELAVEPAKVPTEEPAAATPTAKKARTAEGPAEKDARREVPTSVGESNLEVRGFADDRLEQPPALEQEIPPARRVEAERKRAAPAVSPPGVREKQVTEATRQAAPPAGEGAFYKALVPAGGREDARDATLEGTTEVLTIVSLDGNEMAQLRDTLRDSGGRILEMQTLDAYSSQQVALPYQDRIPPSQAISRGWQIRALVPAENVEHFVSSLEKGSRMQLLHRSTEPPLWPSDPGAQNIQINLVR